MFKISVATKEQMDIATDYLGYKPSGLVMLCMDDKSLTGACEFDIVEGYGILHKVKTDKLEMESVVASAVLNFLDLQGIGIVRSSVAENEKLHKMLGFGSEQSNNDGGYLVSLCLDGYFEGGKCGGH